MIRLPFKLQSNQIQQITLGLVKFARFSPMPIRLHSAQLLLNKVFAEAIEDGDMEFLVGKVLVMRIVDANFTLAVTAIEKGDSLVIQCINADQGDAEIRGNLSSFVQLGAKTVDADTLFFQRKLVMEGDTALGLEFKNLTDGFDLDLLPKKVQEGLSWLAMKHA